MKQKFPALKLYLVGVTIGLFIFGWSAIARTDNVSTPVTAAPASSQIASSQPATSNRGTLRTQPPNLQPIPSMPRIRTRTS
ncbi:MAG TPA: hypothetical protein VFF59_00900 [Anaerolineae bacterium]|nr:hypothetical protein [Anaerolineae bacterium]